MAISLETLAAANRYTADYVAQHGDGEGSVGVSGIVGSVFLDVNWSGDGPFTQSAAPSGYTITDHTKVDLYPNADLLNQMLDDRVDQIYVMNENGILTAVAVGMKPKHAMTIQALFTEVK